MIQLNALLLMMLSILSRQRVHGWTASSVSKRLSRTTHFTHQVQTSVRLFAATSTDGTTSLSATAYQELKSLALEIQKHDDLYYTKAEPTLSDDEYDALVQREALLATEHPDLLARLEEKDGIQTRFGGRVGAPEIILMQEKNKVAHLVPMLSLDNVHTEEELHKWIQRIQRKLPESTTELEIVTEPKLDGLSLSVRYNEDGTLRWAATRGDGTQGQEVTLAVTDMESIPNQIAPLGVEVEVRGEVVLPTSTFEEIKKTASESNETDIVSFSNARNAASGILLRKANNQALRRELEFYAYDAVGLKDDADLRSDLISMGFQLAEPHLVTTLKLSENETEGLEPMLDYHEALKNHKQGRKASIDFSDYDMDGVVHKVVSFEQRSLLGASNRAPRWAVAHKFESQTSLTKLLGVEIQVGRTGALTPVAYLEPVDIQGVNVQRATLHNFVHLQQMMGATKVPVGTPVLVRRAGEVIPQVVQRVDVDPANATDFISLEAPTICPACSSKAVWEESGGNGTGQILRCGGASLECPPRAIGALAHAFSRDAFDITGLSEARIQNLIDEGILKVPSDLFQLASSSPSADELMTRISELPGWGEKSVKNLQKQVDGVADDGISLGRFIYSLGIRFTGRHTSNLVASIYGNVDAFLKDVKAASSLNETESFAILQEETEDTKGVGPALISALQSFAEEKVLVDALVELSKAVPVKAQEPRSSLLEAAGEGKLWNGWSIVFTGSLPGMSRSEAQKMAKELLGAKSTPSAVSKSTSLVVAGDKGGKKLKQAEDLELSIMPAAEFVELVEKLKLES